MHKDPEARGTRVAVLTRYFPPEYTGAGIQLAAVLERLRADGLVFTVLTSGPGPSRPPPQKGLRVLRFATPRAGLAREIVFGLRAGLWLLLHRRWDLLHAIDFSYHTLPAWAVARLLRRPVLVKTTLLEDEAGGGLGAKLLRRVRALGYRSADAVVALSDALEARLREDYGVSGRILRIPNGVDTALFHPPVEGEAAATRRTLGVPEQAFVPVLCGMRLPRKNALGLVEAAARMRHRPVEVLLVGPPGDDPGYEERLQAAIHALPEGVTARVLDALPSEGVAEVLRAADVCVLPSRGEGMPNSLLEGMATGLPCVATDIPGSRDVLAEGGGILVPPEDPTALARTLDELAGDPDARGRLGERALQVARERYSLDRVAHRYGCAYAALLGRGAAGDAPG